MTIHQPLLQTQKLYVSIGVVKIPNSIVKVNVNLSHQETLQMEKSLTVLNQTMALTIYSQSNVVLEQIVVKELKSSMFILTLHNVVNKTHRLKISQQAQKVLT